MIDRWQALVDRLDGVGEWLAPLGLRLLLGWEFFEAGRQKFGGTNWFMDFREEFPFPFDRLPAALGWTVATWSELVLSIALVLGLGTRVAAYGLLVLTIVATAAVPPDHWMVLSELAAGDAISDRGHGHEKLPAIFMIMLVPLVLRGGGRFSLDALIGWRLGSGPAQPWADLPAWGIVLVLLGLPLALLLPVAGLVLAIAGVALAGLARWLRT